MSDVLLGSRFNQAGAAVLEFTSDGVWVPVCAACDVAMVGHNADGNLCCAVCGGVYPEAVKVG